MDREHRDHQSGRARRGCWLAPLRACAAPRSRLLAVPHAGAGPHALTSLLDGAPPGTEVLGVTLPGRESRSAEPFHALAADPGGVVRAVAAELAALPQLPTVVLGHSMGAALAAALVAAEPGLFTSAVLSSPPSTGTPAERAGRWTDDDLTRILRAGGATPQEVLASPAWRQQVLTRLRVDLTLGVRLTHTLSTRRVAVPVTLLGGRDDTVAPPLDVAGWRERAGAGLRVRVLPGGHFHLLEDRNRAAVLEELTGPPEQLEQAA